MPYPAVTDPALTRRIRKTPSVTERTNPDLYAQLQQGQGMDPMELIRQQLGEEKLARYVPRGQAPTAAIKPFEGVSAMTTPFSTGDAAAPYQRQMSRIKQMADDNESFRQLQAQYTSQQGAADSMGGGGVDIPTGGDTGSRIVAAAERYLGTPYSWGGGNSRGPTKGTAAGATYPKQATSTVGFDCSGLVQYAYAQAGLKMPRVSYGQLKMGSRAALNSLRPGDLVGFGNGHHIGIYIGGGKFIESPHTGAQVRISKLSSRSDAWGVKIYH